MADLTRRAFIGRTLLTGATIASGGLATISTSPTPSKVAISQKGIRWTNLNVLSPKAKAYRRFLKGVRAIDFVASRTPLGSGSNKSVGTGRNIRSLITKSTSTLNVVGENEAGKNLARRAFNSSIGQGDLVGSKRFKGTSNVFTSEIMRKIAPSAGEHDPSKTSTAKNQINLKRSERVWKVRNVFSENMHREGRTVYAEELRVRRGELKGKEITRKKRRAKGFGKGKFPEIWSQATSKNPKAKKTTRMRGGGGGGGKTALPGLETAKNPTGMSLLNRFTL